MKEEQVKKWLDMAWEDIRIIDDLIDEKAYGLACFHSQQGIEKSLKVYLLIKSNNVPKIHSIVELIEMCKEYDRQFSDFNEFALIIDCYYIPVRYPDALPGNLPEGMPSKNDALESLKISNKIFSFVKSKI